MAGNLATPSSNLSLINCVFGNTITLSNAENALVSNNICHTGIVGTIANRISNNIIINAIYRYDGAVSGDNNLIENNIILRAETYAGGTIFGTGNRIYNNLFAHNVTYLGTAPITDGNYINIPMGDIFDNQSGTSFTGTSFTYAADYHLQAPGTYLGTNGTQVGIYGGDFPWKEGAVPSNPHIESAIISTKTDESGDLEVKIKVRAQ
jgi:hypothetical protein